MVVTKTTAFRHVYYKVFCNGNQEAGKIIAELMGPENVEILLSDGEKIGYSIIKKERDTVLIEYEGGWKTDTIEIRVSEVINAVRRDGKIIFIQKGISSKMNVPL